MRGGMGSIFASEFGASGHFLHNNGEPLYPHGWGLIRLYFLDSIALAVSLTGESIAISGYEFQNGRSLHQSVTVTWQLRDVPAGAGGL